MKPSDSSGKNHPYPGQTNPQDSSTPAMKDQRMHIPRDSMFHKVRTKEVDERLLPLPPKIAREQRSIASMVIKIISSLISFLTATTRNYEPTPVSMQNWMGRLFTGPNRNVRLMHCTMIGSHDAASHCLTGFGQRWATTQTNNLTDQLNAGVRYLDIRITKNRRGEFIVHHGPVHGGLARKEVIEPLTDYLKKNPSELVMVKLQFDGMDKASVQTFMETEFKEVSEAHALHNKDKAKRLRPPGLITYGDAIDSGKNLLVMVNDEKLKKTDHFTQEELGDYCWRHNDHSIDLWPNTPDPARVKTFNENYVIPKVDYSRNKHDGKIAMLQLQTNVNPFQLFRGGLSSVWRLASFSNHEIPEMITHWNRLRGFKPNVILQDFIGHFNYSDITALTIALNSENMTNFDVRYQFPDQAEKILTYREALYAPVTEAV
ncbi:phosphatidylinositol-specific phospholipase C domain-containing protein [Endozoicomonas arenosclerae]|uniref:phosphatidylinositol-specific phospholipase C domain-containing protein n=1 Tax=Endozoicomonas arenosclerae TaxID=1633495 RepID=UPI0007804923|nr:phosphatidylinositol-specific phospholipase C domain-containing protein [Endozoicomonas arenosclerae]